MRQSALGVELVTGDFFPRLNVGRWQGCTHPLEVVRLEFGATEEPFWACAEVRRATQPSLWLEYVHPLDQRRVADFFSDPKPGLLEYRLMQDSGELLWVRHDVFRCERGADGRTRIDSLLRSLEEEKQRELECLRVSERERTTIGQELHDDVCQILTGLNYLLQVMGRRVGETRPELQLEMHELSKEVSAASVRARSLAHGLFPARLQGESLVPALKELARLIETRFPIKIFLDAPNDVPTEHIEEVVHVFRIVQEAVSNASRHGAASQVWLKVFYAGGHANVLIEDDGSGMPAESSRPEGIGMHTMRYRARELGGDIEFSNRPEGGARVTLRLPLAVRRSAPPRSAAAK